MLKSPWGIGAWAAEAEREEAEEKAAAGSFPSLKEGVSTAKQKKKTKMTLQEFRVMPSQGRGLTPKDMLRLPTGPKERSAEEMQYGRLGGGFSNYGSRPGPSGPNSGRREYEGDTCNRHKKNRGTKKSMHTREMKEKEYTWHKMSWQIKLMQITPSSPNSTPSRNAIQIGAIPVVISVIDDPDSAPEGRKSYGFEDDGRRGPLQQHRVSEFDQPSRADEVDNWASMKKQTALPDHDSRESSVSGKYSSLGGASRADEVDNWASMKKPVSQTINSSFGSKPETDRWARNESFGSGFSKSESDRWSRSEQNHSLSLSSPTIEGAEGVKVNKPNPFGAARPREEVLAEKGLDWKKMDSNVADKKHSVSGGSRPTSSLSSRPETPQSSRSEAPPSLCEAVMRQRPKVNPFGDAKPREVMLEEKGLDWKKIDLELDRRVDR